MIICRVCSMNYHGLVEFGAGTCGQCMYWATNLLGAKLGCVDANCSAYGREVTMDHEHTNERDR